MDHRIPTVLRRGTLLFSVAMGVLMTAGCATPRWTQWGGPNRDFSTQAVGISKDWPENGPKRLWKRELGDGFSAVVTDGRTLYTMFRRKDDHEVVVALDADSGQTVWEYAYPAPYLKVDEDHVQDTQFSTGPNSTPLLIGGRLFTVGFTGKFHCLSAHTGKMLWSHDLFHDYGGTFLEFGYAASPLAYRDTVILPVGGKGHALMAFDQATGEVVWQNGDAKCSYSSPLLIDVEGEDHLVMLMASTLVGVSPKTGEIYWHLKHENQYKTSICTPMWCPGGLLYFVSSGDLTGGRVVRLAHQNGRITPEEIWHNKKIQGGLHNPVRIGDFVYGPGAGQTPILMAFNVKTGKIAWRKRGYPRIKLIYADDKLLLLDGDGNLTLATADPQGIEIHGKTQLLEKPSWTVPTLVGTRLFLRDRKTIMAVDLS